MEELFHNIPPLIGSVLLVLASPDREVASQSLPVAKTFRWLFLPEDLIQSCQTKSLEHLLRFTKTFPNRSPIALILFRTLGTQSLSLELQTSGQR
jgi:hypothetical protein